MDQQVRILVVDDDPHWRDEITGEYLAERGYLVHTAADLEQALELIDRYFYHVAIVDIKLDRTDKANSHGLDVLEKIWSLDEGTIGIVLSGQTTLDIMAQLMSFGVFGFVSSANMNPEDLSRQYKSAGFIKALFTKGEEFREISKTIDAAVRQAMEIAYRRRRQETPFRFFKGLLGRDMQACIRGAGMTEFRQFVGKLCWPFYPWLPGHHCASIIENKDGKVIAIEGLAWSRALGVPVVARFGRAQSFDESLRIVPPAASFHDRAIIQELPAVISDHFKGQAYTIDKIAFEQEFTPPAPKRMSKAPVSLH